MVGRSAVCDSNLGSIIIVYFGPRSGGLCASRVLKVTQILFLPFVSLAAQYIVWAECVLKALCGSRAAGL